MGVDFIFRIRLRVQPPPGARERAAEFLHFSPLNTDKFILHLPTQQNYQQTCGSVALGPLSLMHV